MVTATATIMAALERNWTMVDSALEGLDEATLARRPIEQCNSVAWVLWHMNRVPVPQPRPLTDVLGQMTWDNIAHGGQIAYLRGFYRGMGWHR